jgi:two-component system, CitB family, sensor kinase
VVGVLARMTLARQSLLLQLVTIVAVLISVGAVALAQVNTGFQRTESQRMLNVAETVASMDTVRSGLADTARSGMLQPEAEAARMVSGADFVVITLPDHSIAAGPDPADFGERSPLVRDDGSSPRTWVGLAGLGDGGGSAVAAQVPVMSGDGGVLGYVTVGRDYPGLGERLVMAAPTLLVYLGIATVLGVAGSLLLARRVKRQSLGLEPAEIARLVEHREAMLHGIREGVIGVDAEGRVTLVNDTARALLHLPPDGVGRRLEEMEVEPGIVEVLLRSGEGREQVVLIHDRLVTLNRRPLVTSSGPPGSVTTMRDRTELKALQRELDLTRTATEALRAQAHVFGNRLHVIAGLLELDEHAEVRRYVSRISGAYARLSGDVVSRVGDPSLAALLIAKASLAGEQGARLEVEPSDGLDSLEDAMAADLVTVVGNLVDNALEAVREAEDPSVEVALYTDEREVVVEVRDSGPGVPAHLAAEVFRRGFTTKSGGDEAGRGLGLAITQLVCARRGGTVSVDGSMFTARLPLKPQEVQG